MAIRPFTIPALEGYSTVDLFVGFGNISFELGTSYESQNVTFLGNFPLPFTNTIYDCPSNEETFRLIAIPLDENNQTYKVPNNLGNTSLQVVGGIVICSERLFSGKCYMDSNGALSNNTNSLNLKWNGFTTPNYEPSYRDFAPPVTTSSRGMISVYDATETLFNHNGIKILKPTKAIVYKEDNGDYYLEIEDSIENLAYYQEGYIIRVSTPWGKQGFRCTNVKKKNRKIEVKAWHLFYDSSRYVIADSYVVDKSCNDALDHLNSATDTTSPFTTISDIASINSFRCVRKSLEEAINVILERWGGHIDRDNFEIAIRNSIGQDRGVTLAYGKNIESIEAREDWDNVATKLLPVGYDGQLLDNTYITSDVSYDIPYTKVVSFEQDISEDDYASQADYIAALKADLQSQAEAYIQENKVPKVNYTLKAHLQNVADVGDVVWVKHPKCGIDIETHVISVKWDVISERYKEIEFGNFRSKLKNLVTDINKTVTETVKTETTVLDAKLSKELKEATSEIKGVMGNSYVIYEGDKILVVDTLPKENATNVIMINNGGIGFSNTGINGTFSSAWTIGGTLNMQNINVINLVADMIKGGTLKLGSNLNESGILELYDESNNLICLADKTGLTIYCDNGEYIKLNPTDGFAGYDRNDNKIYWADGDEFHMKKAVVEENISLSGRFKIIGINNGTNVGIGFVPL